MRNQTSFRLTTTLLPTDTTAKTTTVINKVDSEGNKFYPTFTEETVVITNDDRTVMETTRAICTDGALTFVKRGLSDDASETPVDNRKLTWNPGSLCFITAGAGDWIDKDDNITWSGNQTYEGDMTAKGKATYKGRLITEKGVEYPHFDNVAALEAYASPFGGMFAVVDSSGELYRYNAVTETWSVVTTAAPTNPEMADDDTIGTVRVATDAEFAAGTDTGSQGEYLVATPSQILGVSPEVDVNVFELSGTSDTQGAQAILDNVLAGGTPIIHYGQYNDVYYLEAYTQYGLYFYQLGYVSGTSGVGWKRLRIEYSGTTVSSIDVKTRYPLTRVYFDGSSTSRHVEKGQDVLDAHDSGYFVWAISDYNSGGDYLTYYFDKKTFSGANSKLILSTLGGNKHINITFDEDTETVSSVTFS